MTTVKSLVNQYSHITSLIKSNNNNILKIGLNLQTENRPPILLFGEGALGSEIALNLAIYFVTHHGRDDTVTTILEAVDVHIGFPDKDFELLNTTETCGVGMDKFRALNDRKSEIFLIFSFTKFFLRSVYVFKRSCIKKF